MSFVRTGLSKNSNISNVKPPLPSRLQPKRCTKLPLIPNQDDLDDIVNNLSTIVKQSEQSLTPNKRTTSVRRTSSLHINSQENLSNSFVKTSNSNLDISRLNSQRRSLRNVEKFSGIKCSLPSTSSTIPNTFKGLEKHCTPTKADKQTTPVATKSPWRLRFEKFLNHQELTPISPLNQSIAFSSVNKENRTPSFRLSTRRNK